MTERKVTHDTFTITRNYAAAPATVFKAFADVKAKGQWFVGPDEWKKSDHTLDFKVGGREHLSGGPKGGPIHYFDAVYQDIVPNERIIYSYDMHLDKVRISVSQTTIELKPRGKGTRMIFTEQGAFLDGFDNPKLREDGTKGLLDQLGAALKKGK